MIEFLLLSPAKVFHGIACCVTLLYGYNIVEQLEVSCITWSSLLQQQKVAKAE